MPLPHLWDMFGPDYLPYRVLLLSRLIDRGSARDIQGYGVTLAEWRVLAFVGGAGPISASKIGKLGQIDRAEISRAVGKLEAKGLIQREADATHRKRFIISVTEAGQALYATIRKERQRAFREMTAGLSAAEREAMEKGLASMAERLFDG